MTPLPLASISLRDRWLREWRRQRKVGGCWDNGTVLFFGIAESWQEGSNRGVKWSFASRTCGRPRDSDSVDIQYMYSYCKVLDQQISRLVGSFCIHGSDRIILSK